MCIYIHYSLYHIYMYVYIKYNMYMYIYIYHIYIYIIYIYIYIFPSPITKPLPNNKKLGSISNFGKFQVGQFDF